MANFTCPHCDRMAQFPGTGLWIHGRFSDSAGVLWVNMLQCPNPDCRGVVMAATPVDGPDENYRPVEILPMATVHPPDALIPAPVRADLFEARRCSNVQANKATVVLCRRALQGACVDQGASPKKNLRDQIEEVVAGNKVHGSLKEWADAIRLVGNSGAHPGDDGLEEVTAEEADDILAFTEEFMELTYVARERVRQRLAARGKPSPAGPDPEPGNEPKP
jgi:hypothetical protein